MIRHLLCCFLLVALTAISSLAQSDAARDEAVDKIFSFAKKDSPGCALAVIRDGQVVLKRGYGMADLDHDIAISPSTVFHVASVSKQFTAMAIQLLAQQGKLTLDDDIHKYIPELKGVPVRITIRHLLNHTSGLRDQWNLLIMSGWRLSEDVVREEDVLELVSKMRQLNFPPGDQYAYSNTGYTLLGVIAKRVSGQSLREFTDANIFKPLGMTQTFFRDDHAVIVKNQAYAYNRKETGAYALSVPNYDTVGASSLLTTVEDLAKWDQNFYDFRVGGRPVKDAMHVTGVLNNGDRLEYASGLMVSRYKGLNIVEHAGADAGYRSQLLRFPDQRFSVACLCNLGTTAPSQFARQVADIFLADHFTEKAPGSPSPVVAGVTLTPEQLSSKTGVYWTDATEDIARVSIQDGQLHLAMPGYTNKLKAASESRFLLANGAGEVEFASPAPKSGHFSIKFGERKPVVFSAVGPPDTAVARLSSYAGDYHSSEIESTYRIELRDDKLVLLRPKFAPVNLQPVFRDGFITSSLLGTIRFTRDASGKVTGMILSSGRIRGFRLQKIPELDKQRRGETRQMNIRDLVKRSLTFYWRSNLAVIAGVATAVAVLAGALLVGNSVRSSLRQMVLNRLGATDEVITAPGFFRAQLAADLEANAEFQKTFKAAVPLITLEGVVTHDQTKRRSGGVLIYGIDKRFFTFHGVNESAPGGNDVLISPGLATELSATTGETLLLRIEKPSAIPAESLHGRKEDTGLTLRMDVRGTLAADSLGEFSLQPRQTEVRAIFLPIERLQRNLEQDGKANSVLLSRRSEAQSSEAAIAVALKSLTESLTLGDFGLRTRLLAEQGCISLESESAVINDATIDRARQAAEGSGMTLSPVLTYLANSMRIGDRRIPYSLVTALEPRDYQRMKNGPLSTQEHPLLLNQWAATDLQAKAGDKISLDYYVWRDEGALDVASADFQVDGIVPLSGPANDRYYAPDYPGITEATSLSDWDPPFPVDLSLVRPHDEVYWDEYRTTPKAFVLMADGKRLWSTRYGSLTSLRLFPRTGEDIDQANTAFVRELRRTLNPVESGYTVYSARMQGLAASQGATDFGEYFTYFSFFIVVSALLLAALFFRLGIEQRLREIGTLRAVGFGSKAIRGLFLREGVVLAVIGSVIGAAGAVAYGWLMVFGLRTWWVGAVGTTALRLYVSPWSLAIGIAGGILAAIICIILTLRSLTAVSPRSLLAGTPTRQPNRGSLDGTEQAKRSASGRYYLLASVTAAALGFALLAGSWAGLIGEAGGFFGAGTLFLIALVVYSASWLRRDRRGLLSGQGWWAVARLGFRNATFRPGRSVLCIALIGASTFIIVSVDAFRRDPSSTSFAPRSGTGGYQLLGESLLPIVHNLNSEDGRSTLNLTSESGELDRVDFTRFRLRPGDDASCLNLYRPRSPRILGASAEFIRKGRFAFQGSLATTPAEIDNPWLLLDGETDGGAIPVIADANSLAYALHLKLGEEMVISSSDGTALRLRVVAALSDSVLQGELIMSEANFVRAFPGVDGFRFFLVDAPPTKVEALTAFLEDRLSEYGFDATGTALRLAGFHQVENTYLSTFQTLGGLGLLLGTIGLAAVLVRNVIERRRELALLRAVGYRSIHFATMVLAENAFLLAAGLATGFLCAMVAILPALLARGGNLPVHALTLLALVLVTGLAASVVAVRAAFRAPLLPALRGE